MAIFYTSHEGGPIKKFPKSPAHWWAVQELDANLTFHQYDESEMESNIFNGMNFPMKMRCSYLCGIRVHSVFFTIDDNLYNIWDASLLGKSRFSKGFINRKAFAESFRDFIKKRHGKTAKHS